MANAIKWTAASSANAITTELNSLADAAFKIGAEIDNATNKAQYGTLVVTLASLDPSATAYVNLYMVTAPDGTNYPTLVSDNPGVHKLIASIPVDGAASAKVATTGIIQLEPYKTKFILENKLGVGLASSGNTVVLYYFNDEIQ